MLAIIGAGLYREKASIGVLLRKNSDGELGHCVCDVRQSPGAEQFAEDFGCLYETDWKKVIANSRNPGDNISTTNNWTCDDCSRGL